MLNSYQMSQCHNPENVLCIIFAIHMIQTSGKDIGKSIFCKPVALTSLFYQLFKIMVHTSNTYKSWKCKLAILYAEI